MSSPQPLALQDLGPDLHVDVTDAVPPPSVEILGIPLAITDYERTMDWMDATIVDDLTVPDGQPLVWAMNALGHNLTSRVYGPDLSRPSGQQPRFETRAEQPGMILGDGRRCQCGSSTERSQ